MAEVLAPVDPTVFIPHAVRAASKRAEQMMTGEAPPPAEAAAEPPPAEEQTLTLTDDAPDAPPAEAAAEPPPPAAGVPEDKKAQNELSAMKGRLAQRDKQITDMNEEIGRLHTLMAALHTAGTTRGNQPPAELDASRMVSSEEREEYGEELLSVVGKRAYEIVAPMLRAQAEELQSLRNAVAQSGQHQLLASRQTMLDGLTAQLPTWRTVNKDPKFIEWLRLPDPYSGAIRKELLKRAFDVNDTSRVLRFFNGFLADEAATRPAAGDGTTGAPDKGPDKTDLASLAAPGRAKSSQVSATPDEKPYVTAQQISAFYQDVAKGKYVGREKEKDRLERMFHSAATEGRLR